jgi:hypothetical protein
MRHLKLIAAAVTALAAIFAIAAGAASAEPGFLPAQNFKGSGAGGSLNTLGGLFSITCTGTNVLSGVMTTDSKGTADIHFTGCTALGAAVNSLADSAGVILAPSNWELCLINEKELKWGVWLEPTSPVHINLPLSELTVVVGGVIGEITPNELSEAKKLKFTGKGGDPTPSTCGGKTANQTSEKNESKTKEMSALTGEATLESETKGNTIQIMDT